MGRATSRRRPSSPRPNRPAFRQVAPVGAGAGPDLRRDGRLGRLALDQAPSGHQAGNPESKNDGRKMTRPTPLAALICAAACLVGAAPPSASGSPVYGPPADPARGEVAIAPLAAPPGIPPALIR